MTIDRKDALHDVIAVSPSILHGTPCFSGTRVPVQALVDHLETGHTIDDFLAGFPTVKREQAVAFLELAAEYLAACVSS